MKTASISKSLTALAVVLVLFGAVQAVDIIDPDQVRVGMKGVGKSVFLGTRIDQFNIEVLGVLKRAFNGFDMTLVKCSGANLEHTGVIAGMSGSPVYIDGRLLGAVAITWSFQKDPLALVTPIRAMLDVMKREDRPDQGWTPDPFDAASAASGLRPIPCPVAVTGFDQRTCDDFAPRFSRYGMRLVAGGAESGTAQQAAADLEPGSAVGVSLIRGDMEASAIGTLTYREGDRIVAFGHPMFQGGAVNLPMVGGIIHTIMASEEMSSKVFSPTGPIGAVTQDRAPGIAGRIGPKVAMVPVRVAVTSEGGTRDYNYELLDHRSLTADLFEMAVTNALLNREQARFDMTAKVDLTIRLRGYPPIHSRRWFTGEQTVREAASEVAGALQVISQNEFEPVALDTIDVRVEVVPGQEILTIGRVVADRERAKPGDMLRLTVTLDGLRSKSRTEEIDVTIPGETPAGPLQLLVTTPDSALVFALGEAGEKIAPRSLRQMIKLVERIGPENELVVQGYTRQKGMVIAGEQYPNLPPSMLSLLSGSRETGTSSATSVSLLFDKRKAMDRVVQGGQVVWIEIER